MNNLVKKTDYNTKVTEIESKLSGLNRKIVSNKTRYLFNGKQLSYLIGKSYFDEDDNQNYYIFQPISKYLKVTYVNDITYILS